MNYRRSPDAGSVVLVALCFVAVMAIAIGTYLAMCAQAMKLSNRTFQTTLSEHLAEMGLEYGIAALNNSSFTPWASGGTVATWTISGSTATGLVTLPSNKYGSVGVTGLINVRIDNFNVATNARPWDSAAIYSSGDVVTFNGCWYNCIASHSNQTPPIPPATSAFWSPPVSPIVHAEGVVALPDGSSLIKTQVVAALSYSSLFPNALASTSSVTLAAGVTADSYDSSLGTYGQITFPFSPAAPNTGYSAVIAGNSTGSYAVTLAGAVTVNGYVAAPSTSASPYAPNVSYDSTASIVKGSAVIPFPKVDLTRLSRSPYIPSFAVNSAGSGSGLSLAQGANTVIGSPTNVVPTIYNATGNLDFTNPSTTLTITGPVVIDVVGNINILGDGSQIVVTPQGSATIHYSGTFNCSAALGGGIDNQTFNPQKLVFVGTGNSTTNTFSSTIDFYGAIYVPSGTITWSAGNLYGAISADTISFSGGAVHFDTALRKFSVSAVDAPYVITRWREVIGPTDPDRVAF